MLIVIIAGLSAYHNTLESEMQIIPNGQSDTSADMIFKVSGEIKDTDNGQTYKIDSGYAYQSLLFISDEKIYSIFTLQSAFSKDIDIYTHKQNEFMWLDAGNLTPDGSGYKGVENVSVEDKNFRCNVYEYVSPLTEQVYTYYIGIDAPLIYRIDCQIHSLAQIDSKQTIADISITADLDRASVTEGKYEIGEIGEIQNIQMSGNEKIYMSDSQDATNKYYSETISIKTISNTKFLTNAYLNSYGMYKEITLTLDNNSNTDETCLIMYVPCIEGDHLGNSKHYETVDDRLADFQYEYSVNYSYIDKDLDMHTIEYKISSKYDDDGDTLKKMTIEGNVSLYKYEWRVDPYPTSITFSFESAEVSL
ncbi:hypothetical protein A3207_01555 [Candidatus Methanomassiliicoccus intestinalis]|uniref:Uncharacterized protein n=3 Tax=Candidatus Methanomassiliicoccus intestinalis TaxID=1406512 RepID=R9T653_METII|nr:hypothetical protein [Candidatus Methanomassiliicoccus intestinalis]AGN26175.1 hypothetical protein MMINT_08110 [Candidatus Methanomassiliicoccus intestinalis Issoire-Mx1]TQS84745.1 MAG: hypothetical protein A3207_01555 [Candidatus Methanomassiliicoccus intestinalis]